MSNKQNILELCKYRFQQADDALDEARILLDAGHCRGALSRSYYAMFYALQVMVIQNKVKISKHSGVISYFDREFVKPGIIDKSFKRKFLISIVITGRKKMPRTRSRWSLELRSTQRLLLPLGRSPFGRVLPFSDTAKKEPSSPSALSYNSVAQASPRAGARQIS